MIMRATSPRVIMPAPIFRQSSQLYLKHFDASPQPMTLLSIATRTKPIENTIMLESTVLRSVSRPIPTKNIGAKNIYPFMLTRRSMYSASRTLQRIIPAIYAPVISAIPKYFSAIYAIIKQRVIAIIGILLV